MNKKVSKKAEAATEKPFSFDSISDVHDDIQNESPEVKTAAVDAHTDDAVEQLKTAQGQTDKAGNVFNPEIHAVNSEGEPSVTPLGKFRKKKGVSKVSTTNKEILAQQESAQQKAAARAAGQLAADMMIGSATTLLGNEWIPIGEDGKQEVAAFNEHENLRRAFGDYFEAKGIHDFPPGIALSIAVSSYIMPRVVAGPETKSKLSRAKDWMAAKYLAMKAKQGAKKDAAQSDSRNDRERENDTSEKAVPDEPPKATRHARS